MVIVNTEDTRNSSWAKDTSGFGHRMLAKMGWKEGEGLGKDGQGNKNSLRAVKRVDEVLGVGATTDTHGNSGFDESRSNFKNVLERLKEQHGQGRADNEINEDKVSKKKKKKRKDKTSKKSSKSKKSKKVSLAQNRVQAGHAKKMREAKDLSTKSKADLAAIFGTTDIDSMIKVKS